MAKKETAIAEKKPEAPKVETVSYPVTEINKVLDYIGSRPFKEVAGLVQILQSGKVDK